MYTDKCNKTWLFTRMLWWGDTHIYNYMFISRGESDTNMGVIEPTSR